MSNLEIAIFGVFILLYIEWRIWWSVKGEVKKEFNKRSQPATGLSEEYLEHMEKQYKERPEIRAENLDEYLDK